jgi:hypothetical protein
MSHTRTLLVVLAATLAVMAADAAHANNLTISTTTGRLGGGGEFKITGYDTYFIPPASVVTQVDGGQFNTFCIEYNEFISLGSSYDYTVDAGAINGGVSGGNPDYIDEATAKLYYTFWADKWSVASTFVSGIGYAYSGTQRAKDGRDLQMAIWFLEGEITQATLDSYVSANSGSQAQDFVDYANSSVTWADLGRTWVGAGGVRAVNLYDTNGAARQSQLVIVPLPAAAVMGFVLLGVLGLFMGIRRRQRYSFR